MKSIITLVLVCGLSSVSTWASGIQCVDANADYRYQTASSDGGACCGSDSMELSYKGTVIKSVNNRYGMGGHPGFHSDTNPNLLLKEGAAIDLANNSVDLDYAVSHQAMNLTLSSLNGSSITVGVGATEVVSMVCENRRYSGPPRP